MVILPDTAVGTVVLTDVREFDDSAWNCVAHKMKTSGTRKLRDRMFRLSIAFQRNQLSIKGMDELEARIPHPLGDNLCDPPHDQEPHAIVPLDQLHEPLAINREDGGIRDAPCRGCKAEGGDQGSPAKRFGKMGEGEHANEF